MSTTDLERQSLEAHVDLCAIRYDALEGRLSKVETKIDTINAAIKNVIQKSMAVDGKKYFLRSCED